MVACPPWDAGILAKGLCLTLGACEGGSHERSKALRSKRGSGGSPGLRLQNRPRRCSAPLAGPHLAIPSHWRANGTEQDSPELQGPPVNPTPPFRAGPRSWGRARCGKPRVGRQRGTEEAPRGPRYRWRAQSAHPHLYSAGNQQEDPQKQGTPLTGGQVRAPCLARESLIRIASWTVQSHPARR